MRRIGTVAPGVAGADDQPLADIAVVQVLVVEVQPRQGPVVVASRGSAAVGEFAERNPQQRQFPGAAARRPHALAVALAADQHVEVTVALQERHLVDRAAAGLQRARCAAIEGNAEHRRGIRLRCRVRPLRGPHVDRVFRHVEHMPARAQHRRRFATHRRGGQVADADRMQGDALVEVEVGIGAIDARRRQDALEVLRRRIVAPMAQRRQERTAVESPRTDLQRRVEDQSIADQPAGVIARRVVVVAAQLIGGAVAQAAAGVEIEQPDLGAAARIAVADHDHGAVAHQHLVVPGPAGVGVRRMGIRLPTPAATHRRRCGW